MSTKKWEEAHREQRLGQARERYRKPTSAKRGHACEYSAMLEGQGNRCAICGVPFIDVRCNIDHDHVSGEARGLLCNVCNMGIGWIERAPLGIEELLDRVVKYLDRRIV